MVVLGSERMGMANTRREKILLMNTMAYAKTHIFRKEKKKKGKGNCNCRVFVLKPEIYSNKKWEVEEQGTFLDFNIKVFIHYSAAQTGTRECGARCPSPLPTHAGVLPRPNQSGSSLGCRGLSPSQT